MRLALAGNVLVPAPCRVPLYIVLTLVLYTDRSLSLYRPDPPSSTRPLPPHLISLLIVLLSPLLPLFFRLYLLFRTISSTTYVLTTPDLYSRYPKLYVPVDFVRINVS
jgi:hypothetical protein